MTRITTPTLLCDQSNCSKSITAKPGKDFIAEALTSWGLPSNCWLSIILPTSGLGGPSHYCEEHGNVLLDLLPAPQASDPGGEIDPAAYSGAQSINVEKE